MNYFFTSDTHFGHEKIIKYCNRPFKSIEEMDVTLIAKWNAKVKDGDIVFHLGDFCFRNNPWDQLKGNIILIKGNHDNGKSIKTVIDSIQVYLYGKSINLTHYPTSLKSKKINFVGHVHDRWKLKYEYSDTLKMYPIVNVGVDVWNFEPVTIQEIFDYIREVEKNER